MTPHQSVTSNKDEIIGHFKQILILSGFNPNDPALERTPERQWEVLEKMTRGFTTEVTLERMYKDYTITGLPTLRVCPGIQYVSLCEHHFQAFIGEASIAYIPNEKKVTGLSKLPQLVQKYALRPQLQEKMSEEIANELMEQCGFEDIMVVVTGQHMCEIIEGFWRTKPYVTSTIRGLFIGEELRNETLKLMGFNLK